MPIDPRLVSLDEFETMVGDELETFPAWVQDAIDGIAFLVDDRPGPGEARRGTLLLGRFYGIARTRRGGRVPGSLPDTITLYRLPLLRVCADVEDLRTRVRSVLGHEIGHALGLGERRLRELGWA